METRRQITEELNRIAEGARSAYQVAQSNVVSLEKQLDQLKREATGTNQTLLRLRELERAVEAQKAVYEKFLRDKEQIARLTVDTPAGRVIAPAIPPERRSFPNRPLILVLSFAVGLFLGVAWALVLETLSQAQTAAASRRSLPGWLAGAHRPGTGGRLARPPPLGLEALAVWPQQSSGCARDGECGADPARFRLCPRDPSLRRRSRGRLRSRNDDDLLITGVRPGESQPILTVNLALALSQIGANVLLIDGTGRPNGVKAHVPGNRARVQVDLNGQPNLVEALPPAGIGQLFYLPYGGLSVQRGSARSAKRGACSIVLIDGPAIGTPDLERIDIEQVADGVIAVLPAGGDPAGAMARALSQRFGSALVGFIEQAA